MWIYSSYMIITTHAYIKLSATRVVTSSHTHGERTYHVCCCLTHTKKRVFAPIECVAIAIRQKTITHNYCVQIWSNNFYEEDLLFCYNSNISIQVFKLSTLPTRPKSAKTLGETPRSHKSDSKWAIHKKNYIFWAKNTCLKCDLQSPMLLRSCVSPTLLVHDLCEVLKLPCKC